jgi:hypothetical protein
MELWKSISDRLYSLAEDILSRTATTKEGLAVQARAISAAAAELWDMPEALMG